MLHLTKREIYKAFADWYGLGGNAAEVMQASDRLTHFKDMVITAANRERLEKAQVIWEIAQCAPELWSRDNKIDVGLIVGYDCDFSMELFPALRKDIQKQFSRDSTAMFLERKYLPLAPIAWYLNACSPLMSSFGVGQLGSVAHDSSAVVYDRVCSKLEAAVTFGLRNLKTIEVQKDVAACYETMKRMIRAFKVSYYSLAEASLEYQASVNRNGFTVTWLYWNFIRNRWTAQDARVALKLNVQSTTVLNGGDSLSGFFEKIPTPKRPIVGAGGVVQGFVPFFDENTTVPVMQITGEITETKHDHSAPVGYDAADTMLLSGTKAEYTFLTTRKEGDPLDNPVAAWLAETLRPKTINWTSDDPIVDVLEAAAEATAWKDALGDTLAKQAAVLVHNLHQLNKGTALAAAQVAQANVKIIDPMWNDVLACLKRAIDNEAYDWFTKLLDGYCGERIILKAVTIAPNAWQLTHRIGDKVYFVLWASTGQHVVSNLHRNKFDFMDASNMHHLRACYNAHIEKLGRTKCSHSTSQKS